MDDTKKKILIVDDEPDMLTIMAAILHNGGYDVVKASSGKQGVALAQSEQPDLILLDIRMPEMDGVQTTDLLKNNESTRGIPIAYLTNLVEEEEVADGHVLGSKIGDLYFIPKTYRPEKIIELIKQNLESANKNNG
jgi:CheY-like chemotaxis protein